MLQPNILKDLCLTWRNISYTVEKKVNGGNLRAIFGLQHTEFIQLLNGVNGIVSSGMLMAIMGPSGAGKTTLLATISRRVKGKATGDVLLNGKPIDTGQMIRISGFVPQTDLAVESLTILEHMEFMACMKMDRRLRASVRKQRIMTLLGELGLAKSTNTKLSALSGGERKRVTLAVQLLTEPSILFCDEPTTGLDSYGAMTVVKTLREVAASGRIVICSLHQPASGLFVPERFQKSSHTDAAPLAHMAYIRRFQEELSLFALAIYNVHGLLISLPYMNITSQALDQGSIQNMQGLLYLVVVETVFTFNYAVFYTFPRELPLLLRDIASGLYGPAPYYICKVIVLIPGAIIQPLLYSAFIFAITGLKGGLLGFVYFALPVVVCAISASALGLFLSASFQSVNTASLFSVPLDFLGLMFCGIYLHLDHLAPGIAWLKYLSQFYYGLEAVSLTQWHLIDHINCSPDPEEPCISSGLGVLEKYGYLPNHYVTDIVGLLVIFVVSHLAGFLVIKHRSLKEPIY
ncbi:Protein brown [Melipona quadrifasciata]|uniref:Protein brown n=1 Tax=Melipona quadrifasciata TaxID=166423 RepID=A0A0N0BFB7_9HYME|nr:Protein brown [Melipona quadrifasciata]